MKDLRNRLVDGVVVADALVASIRDAVAQRVRTRGKIDRALIDAEQHSAHGLAWYATYAELLRSIQEWAELLEHRGLLGEVEVCIAEVLVDEYLAQMLGGIAMSQSEFTRPVDFDLPQKALHPICALVDERAYAARQMRRSRLTALLAESRGSRTLEATGVDAESDMIREQFRAFVDAKVTPDAHDWYLENKLIPLELVEELAQLGVFGLTIPEEYGGAGLGKIAMCLVSEELSRGYLGVGSLATRSEIAAELIMCGGTETQKRRWLPAIATGSKLPTAVFTETGS